MTLKSLFNVSKFIAYTALPTHLFSWNKGKPHAVSKFDHPNVELVPAL
jgi:hypothetical protein